VWSLAITFYPIRVLGSQVNAGRRAVLYNEGWVPIVPRGNAETPEADLRPFGSSGNILRGISAVSNETRVQQDLLPVHYVSFEKVPNSNKGVGMVTRMRMELVPAKLSLIKGYYFALVRLPASEV